MGRPIRSPVIQYISVTCPLPDGLENGIIEIGQPPIDGRYPYSATLYFSYSTGYTREGISQTTCLDTGKWSNANPVCNFGNGNTVLLYHYQYDSNG